VWREGHEKDGNAGFPVAVGIAYARMPQRVLIFFEERSY
jgi:hypothetical protein